MNAPKLTTGLSAGTNCLATPWRNNRPCPDPSHTLCACSTPADVADDALPPAAAAELRRAACGGLVPDLLACLADVQTPGQPAAAQPAAAAGRHRRQGRRTRPRQADPAALRPLGRRRGARRLRHHRRRTTGVRRTVAAHRRQPAAAGHRLGRGHGDRRRGRRVGSHPAVPRCPTGSSRCCPCW